MAELSRTLRDVAQDYRVAMARAEREFDHAWLVAAAQRNRAELAAKATLAAARGVARANAERRRTAWLDLRDADTADLLSTYRRHAFMLTPAMAAFRDRAAIDDATWHTRVIGSILRRRGVRAMDIPETMTEVTRDAS